MELQELRLALGHMSGTGYWTSGGSQLSLPSLRGDFLPHGRWACSSADVEAAFVTGHGPERAEIWADWLTALALLKELVGSVPAAWLSGSFLSSKPVPGDIDSVFIVDTDALLAAHQALPPEDWEIVLALTAGNGAKSQLGLNVDSYILEWHPTPTPQSISPQEYYFYRGYWDDLWVRAKEPSNLRLESIPRRGYVEVLIDGYK